VEVEGDPGGQVDAGDGFGGEVLGGEEDKVGGAAVGLWMKLVGRTTSAAAALGPGIGSVSELAEPFDMSFAPLSKYLRVLGSAGLVTRGRDAQYRPAMLNARPLQDASAPARNRLRP
jgi:hypothetical protein